MNGKEPPGWLGRALPYRLCFQNGLCVVRRPWVLAWLGQDGLAAAQGTATGAALHTMAGKPLLGCPASCLLGPRLSTRTTAGPSRPRCRLRIPSPFPFLPLTRPICFSRGVPASVTPGLGRTHSSLLPSTLTSPMHSLLHHPQLYFWGSACT